MEKNISIDTLYTNLVLHRYNNLSLDEFKYDLFPIENKNVLTYSKYIPLKTLVYDEIINYVHLKFYRSFFGSNSNTIRIVIFPRILVDIPDFFCVSSSVEKVTMPKTLTRIGKYFLSNCKMIEKIEINDVKSIGANFMNESGVKNITFNTKCIMIIEGSFMRYSHIVNIDLNLPYLVNVQDYFMHCCKSLITAKFNFPSVTRIGSHFLSECEELIDFECNISGKIISIGNYFLRGTTRDLKFFKMCRMPKITSSGIFNIKLSKKVHFVENSVSNVN